jgi:predicted glycoside hydrolase/deacetylase ChbG (UPF0249 family)
MKQLVINADDFGADEARNAGIIEAIQKGIVTSTSILANGPAFKDTIIQIPSLNPAASFGIHINLSEGKPVTSNLRLLIGDDGNFLKKAAAHRRLTESRNQELGKEISEEVSAQVERLLESGIRIDHLDGHQHVHVFSAVFPIALKIARHYGIPWVRIPEESAPFSNPEGIPRWLRQEVQFFSRIAKKARLQVKGDGVKIPDHFRGLDLKGRFSVPVLCDLLQKLPPGLTELMVHPGRVPKEHRGPFSGFSTIDRERELETLLDPRFQEALKHSQTSLTPFPNKEG